MDKSPEPTHNIPSKVPKLLFSWKLNEEGQFLLKKILSFITRKELNTYIG